jgi:hypothetical protein
MTLGAQLTLVAFYGAKRDTALVRLIRRVQDVVGEALADAFTPSESRQVHATIIGLERLSPRGLDNRNFAQARGRPADMNLTGFFAWLRDGSELPIHVRIGGFADRPYGFVSRGERPYARSFSVQGDRVVMMGWPVSAATADESPGETLRVRSRYANWPVSAATADESPPVLDALRRAAQAYGILHAYHRAPADVDNDLYFRIGLVDRRSVSHRAIEEVEHRVREDLARLPPLITEVGLADLQVAAYIDEMLPPASTLAWALAEPALEKRLVDAGVMRDA